jgi:MoaA/NifB/PqqE/SkfB family radical SAM enzyme
MEPGKVLEKLSDLFKPSKPEERKFGSIQIEATSECFLQCAMCPRTAFIKEWRSQPMPFSAFEKISRYFPMARHVHLQGWGEPLLHERIYDMISTAKAAGCEAGFTTNGMLLKEATARRLVELGVDIIGVSIAGATKEAHESIRVKCDFNRFVSNIKTLSRVKNEAGSKTPKVVLSFLMTKTNIQELPSVVKLAGELGVEELVATNLDYTSTRLHDELKVFSCDEVREEYLELIEKAQRIAKKLKLSFRAYPLKTEEVIMCELNPRSFVYISQDGLVAPCVYLNQTRTGTFPRIFCGASYEVKRTYFGDINKEDLLDIWDKPEYRAFREAYARRHEAYYDAYGDIPIDFGFTEKLEEAKRRADSALRDTPMPEVCRTCYKAYGI